MNINIEPEHIEAALYLVSTPIGNLEDITLRSLKILASADIIACEDTRHTGQLLKSYGIAKKRLESYHEHNESEKSRVLAEEIMNGSSVALVTDAGSPGISDPGFRLVKAALDNNLKIVPLPGATAFIPALTASGLAVHSFIFYGFPPQKKGRRSFLERISESESTIILYESPYKIIKLIQELIEINGPDRKACLAREISKIYEEYIRGNLKECLDILTDKPSIKGEFVIVIEGASKPK